MPTLTSTDFTASAVLEATRTVLGTGWQTFPAHNGQIQGTVRSDHGHRIELLGANCGFVYAAAMLPDGTRFEANAAPTAPTAAAYGVALAQLIARTLAPAHNALSETRANVGKIRAAIGRDVTTHWSFGRATTSWALRDGGRALHHTEPRPAHLGDPPQGPGAESWVRFTDLNPDQVETVLRAIDTTSDDVRQHAPVHGLFAQRMKAAAPGLRPLDTVRFAQWGRQTIALGIDGLVKVEFVAACHSTNVTVTGSIDSQVRAAAAL
ncbi:hypothetical protein [Streptomyces tirandamycinicus]|uniref:Uncharacterized protein n=1 Tax=Streptomyces tirandamycinicus TaxID=2174846 RepID=A0A2S1T1V7_9ACTN|nr:hypothetical protein [Streptomyces tirandamycinicus]AWI32653.1 hypothetical protein DDW44_30505 [Streptomyces tirandamycinicus]